MSLQIHNKIIEIDKLLFLLHLLKIKGMNNYKKKLETSPYPSVSYEVAARIQEKTGSEVRVTVPGHMQRGGSPTCKDRVYASMMGAMAVDLLVAGKSCRVVGYRHGEFVDFDINEALAMHKGVDEYMYEISKSLV